MPRMRVDTRRERDHIEGTVRTFLARFIQVKTLVDGSASSWRTEAFHKQSFNSGQMSDMQAFTLTMAIILGRTDRDIARGAWRATAHRLIRRAKWPTVTKFLGGGTTEEAKTIVTYATIRIYAEILDRDLQEDWNTAA